MAVRSALRAGRPLRPRAVVRLEGLGELKNPMTLGIEPATVRLVA
jgi:hypothetical protein